MITPELTKYVVLVTGGTRGFGKAVALEFARTGASVVVTHRWGSADEDELLEEFQREGAPTPTIVECDVSDEDANRELLAAIRSRHGKLDVIISNVAFAKVTKELEDLQRQSLELSLRYSAWPVVELVQLTHEVLGRFPRYVVAISSDGGEVCHLGYDFAGAAKATLETLVRYLSVRLKSEGVRVNVLRPGFMDTASSRAVLGDATVDALAGSPLIVDPRQAARACLALCSGWMDAVTGQVIVADGGASLLGPTRFVSAPAALAADPSSGTPQQ